MMGVYGKRCLGLVKEGCKGTVRLEVCEIVSDIAVEPDRLSIRICSCTISYCSTDTSSTARKLLPRSGVQLDMVSFDCIRYCLPADPARGDSGFDNRQSSHTVYIGDSC
jgi:hypothetical protein